MEVVGENVLTPKMRRILDVRLQDWTEQKRTIAMIEYEKFFLLALHFGTSSVSPVTEDIDRIWHFCILNTRDYIETCRRFGAEYLHHEPSIETSLHFSEADLEIQVLKWLTSYYMNFGAFNEDSVEYWGIARILCHQKGWLIADLNSSLEWISRSEKAF